MKIGKKWHLTIEGHTPLLYSRMKKEVMDEMKELKKDELSEWEEENWWKKAEYDEENRLLFPPEWLKGTLVNACKATKIVPYFGKKNQTYTSYAESFMVTSLNTIGVVDDLEAFGKYVGSQGKNSTRKVWRIRPMLKKWKAELEIIDPEGRMKKSELETLLEYAGLMVGVGDGRKINFGRFDVIDLKET